MAILQERPVKGARISTFYPVKSLPPLASLDSAFQLQEYISLLIRLDVHDVERIVSIPGRTGVKEREGSDDMRGEGSEGKENKGDVAVDEACWIYEQLRRLAQDLSHPLITTLQQECTRQTCPEMKAGEWLYLCVAHGNDGSMEQCCAIDYILHTLDSATALLNSPRAFPSRLSIPPTSQRHFSSLARRLGRIFAHAYYHHREAFEQAEAESSLYERFLVLVSKFNLVPTEFLVIPARMQAIHDERERERGRETEVGQEANVQETRQSILERGGQQWEPIQGSSSIVGLNLDGRKDSSPPGPAGPARNPSPRKGRSRTDTMVYSEAVNVVEELSKGESFSEADLDRAIAQERMLATVEQGYGESVSAQPETEFAPSTEQLGAQDPQGTIRLPDDSIPRIQPIESERHDAPSNEPESAVPPPEEINVLSSAEPIPDSPSEPESESTASTEEPLASAEDEAPQEPATNSEAGAEVAPASEPDVNVPTEEPVVVSDEHETAIEEVSVMEDIKEQQDETSESGVASTDHQETISRDDKEEEVFNDQAGVEEQPRVLGDHQSSKGDLPVDSEPEAAPEVQEHHSQPES